MLRRWAAGFAILYGFSFVTGCGSTTDTRTVTAGPQVPRGTGGATGAAEAGGIPRSTGGDSGGASPVPADGGRDAGSPIPRCVPGDQQACACLGGVSGIHICEATGTWGVCLGCSWDAGQAPVPSPCAPPTVLCGAACVDTSTDAHHCGACDHDCLGTACASGRCAPVVLATDHSVPGSIAVNATHVYWTSGDGSNPATGSIQRVSIAGGVPETFAANQYLPGGIALDAKHVYWGVGGPGGTFDGSLVTAPLAGGIPATLASSGRAYPGAIAVDATSVFWVDGPYHVQKIVLATGEVSTLDSQGAQGSSVAVRDGYVYWTAPGGGNVSGVMAVAVTGGTASNIVPADDAYAVAVDATSVYWTTYYAGTVNRASTIGDDATVLADGQSTPIAVAVDSAHVYWANKGGTIRRISISGGKALTLAAGQAGPAALAIDGTSVYWTNADDDTIMKVAK